MQSVDFRTLSDNSGDPATRRPSNTATQTRTRPRGGDPDAGVRGVVRVASSGRVDEPVEVGPSRGRSRSPEVTVVGGAGRRGDGRRSARGPVEVAAEGVGGHRLRRSGHHLDRSRIVPPRSPGGRAGGREVLRPACLVSARRPIGGGRGEEGGAPPDGCRISRRAEWGPLPRHPAGRGRGSGSCSGCGGVRPGVGPSPRVRRRRWHPALPLRRLAGPTASNRR